MFSYTWIESFLLHSKRVHIDQASSMQGKNRAIIIVQGLWELNVHNVAIPIMVSYYGKVNSKVKALKAFSYYNYNKINETIILDCAVIRGWVFLR